MKFKENRETGKKPKSGTAERKPNTLSISVDYIFGTETSWRVTPLRPSSNTFSSSTSELALYMRCLNNSLNLHISQQNTEKELIRNLNFKNNQHFKRFLLKILCSGFQWVLYPLQRVTALASLPEWTV